jgi:adenine-specific DNA methylase
MKDLILITDPPFFDEVQYTELSFFYWAWLRESKFKDVVKEILRKNIAFRMRDEMIVNPNKGINYAT